MVITKLHWDEAEEKLIVERTQDAEPILRWNQMLYNAERRSSSLWKGGHVDGMDGMVHVARIPLGLVEHFMKCGADLYNPDQFDQRKWRQILNDPEWRKLRTAPGRI